MNARMEGRGPRCSMPQNIHAALGTLIDAYDGADDVAFDLVRRWWKETKQEFVEQDELWKMVLNRTNPEHEPQP
jgi:hypothetical protein